MQIDKQRKLYFPALSILIVVLILLIFMSISTYRNLNRQKATMLDLVQRQGVVLLDALEASARIGITIQGWNAGALKKLITEVGINQDIAYLFLLDHTGSVIYEATTQTAISPDIGNYHLTADAPVQSRLVHLPGNLPVYELAKHFDPLLIESTFGRSSKGTSLGSNRVIDHRGCIIVLGLKMIAFNEVHQADLHHAVVMGVIVLALGIGVLFFFFVIQRYIRVNRALHQARDYTRQVVASLAGGLVSIDAQGMVRSFNLPALKLLDVSSDTLKSRPLHRLLDFSDTGIGRTLGERRAVLEKEIFYQSPGGKALPLAINVTPINEADTECCGAVILLRDLSDIKNMEAQMRQAEKLAAIGKMAASVAHEIRNPLSSIKGFAQFLHKNIAEGAREREYTKTMIQEVNRINSVVTDLLTYSRPMDDTSEPTDVIALINHVIRLVHPDAKERDIVIEKRFDADEIVCVMDANKLTQALLNLLLNATNAIGRDGTITVGAQTNEGMQALRLWVEDNGPGVSDDLQVKIFEPFFTMREKGTGLGLAIVLKIVEHHGGRVDLSSPPPGRRSGCRFTIQLPLTDRTRGNAAGINEPINNGFLDENEL